MTNTSTRGGLQMLGGAGVKNQKSASFHFVPQCVPCCPKGGGGGVHTSGFSGKGRGGPGWLVAYLMLAPMLSGVLSCGSGV